MSDHADQHPQSASAPTLEDKLVKVCQYAIACSPAFIIGGVIVWVGHLIRISLRLNDVPSGAIGISLVAIPVFIILMSVMLYVFWGLIRAGERK